MMALVWSNNRNPALEYADGACPIDSCEQLNLFENDSSVQTVETLYIGEGSRKTVVKRLC